VTALRTALDERALDRLMLGTDAAVVAYQEQRFQLQAAQGISRRIKHEYAQLKGNEYPIQDLRD
jgi:hypothetical protein